MVQKVKQSTKETIAFIKQLALFAAALLALMPVVAGLYAALMTRTHSLSVEMVATVFSGAMSTIAGSIILHKVLMHKKKEA